MDNKFKIPIIRNEEILNAQMCRNAILYDMVWHGMAWYDMASAAENKSVVEMIKMHHYLILCIFNMI